MSPRRWNSSHFSHLDSIKASTAQRISNNIKTQGLVFSLPSVQAGLLPSLSRSVGPDPGRLFLCLPLPFPQYSTEPPLAAWPQELRPLGLWLMTVKVAGSHSNSALLCVRKSEFPFCSMTN